MTLLKHLLRAIRLAIIKPQVLSLSTKDGITHRTADMHPCFDWDSNPRTQCSSDEDCAVSLKIMLKYKLNKQGAG